MVFVAISLMALLVAYLLVVAISISAFNRGYSIGVLNPDLRTSPSVYCGCSCPSGFIVNNNNCDTGVSNPSCGGTCSCVSSETMDTIKIIPWLAYLTLLTPDEFAPGNCNSLALSPAEEDLTG